MTLKLHTCLVFSAVMMASSFAWSASYDQAGSLEVESKAFQGTGVKGEVAYPKTAGKYPVLVLGHGFSASPTNQIGWGKHFASYGFVTIAPELCSGFFCAPDATKATDIVNKTLEFVKNDGALSALSDLTIIGLEGHSAGGQAMTVVASNIKPQAMVLFDPVAGMGMGGGTEPGQSAVPKVCNPLLTIFAENHMGFQSCNQNGNWKPFAMSSTGPRMKATVIGATHCDGENNPRNECGFVCGGGADATRQARFAHYSTAWFLAYLKNDAAAKAEIDLAKLTGDSALKDAEAADGPNCSPVPNGGSGGSGGSGTAGTGTAGSNTAGSATAGTGQGTAGSDPGTGGTAGTAGTAGSVGTAGQPAAGGNTTSGSGGGTTGTAGSVTSGNNGTSGSTAGTNNVNNSSEDAGGCSCRMAESPRRASSGAVAGLLLGLSLFLRRKK
jgi:MYXO-CTERM domain-containing protein